MNVLGRIDMFFLSENKNYLYLRTFCIKYHALFSNSMLQGR
jgi:hypothetical protein